MDTVGSYAATDCCSISAAVAAVQLAAAAQQQRLPARQRPLQCIELFVDLALCDIVFGPWVKQVISWLLPKLLIQLVYGQSLHGDDVERYR